MAQRLPINDEQKMAPLLGSIIEDTQKLVRQELALAKIELKEELGRLKSAAISSSVGIYLGAIAGLLLAFMLQEMLFQVTGLPTWACFGILALVFGGAGLFLLYRARETAKEFDIVPRETVESIKENVQWIKNRT